MTYKKDTKLTFDVSGVLTRSSGVVQIGCQQVPLLDIARVAAGDSLSVNGTVVRARVTGTADGSGTVSFEGSDRTFSEGQIADVATNLTVEEPASPEWQNGDVVMVLGKSENIVVVRQPSRDTGRDSWRYARDGRAWAETQADVDSWITDRGYKVQVLVKGGKALAAVKPDPSTLAWQDGDIIRNRNGGSRTRRNGRWVMGVTDTGERAWGDDEWESYIARQQSSGNPHWYVARRGGYDLAA